MYLGGSVAQTSTDAHQVSGSVVNRNTIPPFQSIQSLATSNENEQAQQNLLTFFATQLREKTSLLKSLNPATNKTSTP